MKILLLTPPLTQLNTPYPATAYLKGFLTGRGCEVYQGDLGIELILKIFSKEGLEELFEAVAYTDHDQLSDNSLRIIALADAYIETVTAVIRFLQNKDTTLAHRICQEGFLPKASRFDTIDDLDYSFGTMGIQDKARYLATMYIEDLGDLIIDAITPHFGFSRYAESLGMSATTFDALDDSLQAEEHLIDHFLLEILHQKIETYQPDVVGFSVPFPGNLYGALKCGQYLKQDFPNIKIVMGGGYPNTELRELTEPKVFDYLDFITLDDGELPFLKLIDHLQGKAPKEDLHRTYSRENGKVIYYNQPILEDIPHAEIGTPDYSDLPLDQYLSVIEMANPMHRLWSDGRWNKLTIAHGCYWKRCSFCDVTLDYIGRYDAAPAAMLVDRIEHIVAQTGETGFHFVDEAAPPKVLRDLALELIKRKVSITWWANIRFEKTFTDDLCHLLAAAGCIAVSGGLEVASDRLLALMEKGVTIAQVAKVTRSFTDAGIMVHAYLMYGFPTETEQETIDSLEIVRQLFLNECIQSGYWHRFSMTAHSPVGKHPEKYNVVKVGPQKGTFAYNDLVHDDPLGCDHAQYSDGLKKALYNYMHGIGLETPVEDWFDFEVPATTHDEGLVAAAVSMEAIHDFDKKGYRLIWLGAMPHIDFDDDTAFLTFITRNDAYELETSDEFGEWLMDEFQKITLFPLKFTVADISKNYKRRFRGSYKDFMNSEPWEVLRTMGLLLVR